MLIALHRIISPFTQASIDVKNNERHVSSTGKSCADISVRVQLEAHEVDVCGEVTQQEIK